MISVQSIPENGDEGFSTETERYLLFGKFSTEQSIQFHSS
jgi:hypothetical protein